MTIEEFEIKVKEILSKPFHVNYYSVAKNYKVVEVWLHKNSDCNNYDYEKEIQIQEEFGSTWSEAFKKALDDLKDHIKKDSKFGETK